MRLLSGMSNKKITSEISVIKIANEIQVRIGERVEYVWFCNTAGELAWRWEHAIDAAERLAKRIAA